MTVAVVAPGYTDSWDEREVLARRTAGALACTTDVELLVPGPEDKQFWDGAVRVRAFGAPAPDPSWKRAWRLAALGIRDLDPYEEVAPPPKAHLVDVPGFAQEELVRSGGGDPPGLYRHLHGMPY